jgi:S1-C subfamily serine protease
MFMPTKDNPLTALSDTLAEAVAKAGASTVLVDARRRLPASGIAYKNDLVLTADHVVERDEDLHIWLPDGKRLDASLAGRDPGNDLALLRLAEGRLEAAKPAPELPRVGQFALALGRASGEIEASLGVISAIGGPVRTGRGGLLEQYLRTDAIPYPGFSGGPLVDASGQLLGLNTSCLAPGMLLTIPTRFAWQVAEALATHGHVRRGYLGIRSQPVELSPAQRNALGREQENGLLLVSIESDGPAAQGGLMVGDILVGLGGAPLDDPDQLFARLSGDLVGKPTPVQILRGGQLLEIQVTIGERK